MESFPTNRHAPSEAPEDPQRRKFLREAIAAAGGAALAPIPDAFAEAPEQSRRPFSREDAEAQRQAYRELVEQELALLGQEFKGTKAQLEQLQIHFETELSFMLPLGSEVTKNDPEHRTRLEYLRTALELPELDLALAEQIRHFVPAKAFVESGLDASKVSPDGARGILQFMPETWEEHKCSPDANILSLVDQVCATESLITQIEKTLRTGCKSELTSIREEFFNGNETAFNQHFYIPVIMNGFNAGASTMSEILRKFAAIVAEAKNLATIDETIGLPKGKDVYALMAHLAVRLGMSDIYQDQSSQYVYKILAAREVLDQIPEAERVGLLGEVDVAFNS